MFIAIEIKNALSKYECGFKLKLMRDGEILRNQDLIN
jgi:hypothetical protein